MWWQLRKKEPHAAVDKSEVLMCAVTQDGQAGCSRTSFFTYGFVSFLGVAWISSLAFLFVSYLDLVFLSKMEPDRTWQNQLDASYHHWLLKKL